MIDIAIALYVISLLSSLAEASKIILIATIFTGILSPLIATSFDDFFYDHKDKCVALVVKYLKIYLFAVIIPAVFFIIAIPSERTMYMIAGLYASDKVLSSVQDSEIAKQAERTLLAKLQELEKEYLTEEK